LGRMHQNLYKMDHTRVRFVPIADILPVLSYDEWCTARVPRTVTACQNEAIEVVKCR